MDGIQYATISLTELGEQVHAACVRMVNTAREIHALAGSYSARPNGVVRISAPVVLGPLWLAPLLPAFLERYPEVDVRLSLVDRNVDLIEEGIDLAIRISAGLVPDFTARAALAPGRAVRILADWTFDEPHASTVHAVYMPGPHRALKVRAMIDYLVAEGAPGA